MRDTKRAGKADSIVRFGPSPAAKGTGGTGIALYKGYLYAEAGPTIVRYKLSAGQRFAGAVVSPDKAAHRPVGLAVAPDGALFITNDWNGRIWRVTH